MTTDLDNMRLLSSTTALTVVPHLLLIFTTTSSAQLQTLGNATIRYQDVVSAHSLDDPLSGHSSMCTPGRAMVRSFVCDASALLPRRSAHRIDTEIQNIYTAQGSYKYARCNRAEMQTGYLIEVALVRRMDTGPNSAPQFANTLFRMWQAGQPSICGNGVLLLVSLEDRKYYFAVGDNVRRYMSSSRVNRVQSVLVRYLKRNNLYLAVLNAVITLGRELAAATPGRSYGGGHPPPAPQPAPPSSYNQPPKVQPSDGGTSTWGFILTIISAISGFVLLIACCNGTGGKEAALRKKRQRTVSRKLAQIKQEYDSAILPQYIPTSCPACSEPFSSTPANGVEDGKYSTLDKSDRGPTIELRSGRIFHEECLVHRGISIDDPVDPVTNDSSTSAGDPPTLTESRDMDLAYRVGELQKEFPDIVTNRMVQSLLQPPQVTQRYGSVPQSADDYGNPTSGPAWGQLIGAAGAGALAAWGFQSLMGMGRDNDERDGFGSSGYDDWSGGWGTGDNNGSSGFGFGQWGGQWGSSNGNSGSANASSGWGNGSLGGGGGDSGGGGGGGGGDGFGGGW